MFSIKIPKKAKKQIAALEEKIRLECEKALKTIRGNPFIGALDKNRYHLHIKYHWIIVWEVNKTEKIITVTYIGSRENAPY